MSSLYNPNYKSKNSIELYKNRYNESIKCNDSFWGKVADRITWIKTWDTISNVDYNTASIKWFEGATLNASYNCIDRHVLMGNGDRTAIIWEGNDSKDTLKISYNQLLVRVSKFANGLKSIGIEKGDRVCIYMQMIPELAIAMLACARIGAVHSIVFGAFSSDSLSDRINDSSCKVLITQDTGVRGTKLDIPMKSNADQAVASCPSIEHVVVVKRTGTTIDMKSPSDIWWDDLVENQNSISITPDIRRGVFTKRRE